MENVSGRWFLIAIIIFYALFFYVGGVALRHYSNTESNILINN